MKRTTYQVPELRDENDNIIQQGAFGKNTALANSTNDGWIDYVANDLMYLYNNTMGGTGGEINTETITGKTGTITNLTATTVKAGTLTADALSGPLTGNVTGTADKAIADGSGNNIVNTYVTKSGLASSVTTATGKVTTLTATDNTLTNVTITGATSVPTANAGDSSKAIANTAYVQGELTNYLPLSGGTLTGVVNGVTPTAGDNSTKIATTEFVNAKAGNYLPLSGGRMTGVLTTTGSTNIPINIKTTGTDYRDIQIESSDGKHRIAAIRSSKTSEGRCEIMIGASTTSNATPEGITISRSTTNIYATAPTPDATDNSTKIATTGFVRTIVPAGVVLAYARGAVPTGWLLCDGSAVSRTNYAALYAVIGTTYGAGNGSTTFNLPNLVDKFVEGSATAGTVKSAGLPNITGSFKAADNVARNGLYAGVSDPHGAFATRNSNHNVVSVKEGKYSVISGSLPDIVQLDASKSNSIYGNSTTVQPPALTMRYIIKY